MGLPVKAGTGSLPPPRFHPAAPLNTHIRYWVMGGRSFPHPLSCSNNLAREGWGLPVLTLGPSGNTPLEGSLSWVGGPVEVPSPGR